jgi:hypothetical protein
MRSMYDKSKRPATACSKCGGERRCSYGGVAICPKCNPNLAAALLPRVTR